MKGEGADGREKLLSTLDIIPSCRFADCDHIIRYLNKKQSIVVYYQERGYNNSSENPCCLYNEKSKEKIISACGKAEKPWWPNCVEREKTPIYIQP